MILVLFDLTRLALDVIIYLIEYASTFGAG
jgi:hypothetical protein